MGALVRMHHSDVEDQLFPVQPVQGSSLQAILYIDRDLESAKPPTRSFLQQPHTAIGLCVLAAVCAFGAGSYALKQSTPKSTARAMLSSNVKSARMPVLSAKMHAVIQPHAAQLVALQPVKLQVAAPVKRRVVTQHIVAMRIAKPAQHRSIPAHLTVAFHATKPMPHHVVAVRPIHVVTRRSVAFIKHPTMTLHPTKPVQHHILAVRPVHVVLGRSVAVAKHSSLAFHPTKPVPRQIIAAHPISEVATTSGRHHRHHIGHRRQVALLALPQLAIHDTPIQSMPSVASAVADPAITSFTASPQTIPVGSGSTICVSTRHATQLSISGIGELNPLLLDCRHVSPDVTTTYTAWAVNNLGVTVSQNVTITVTH